MNWLQLNNWRGEDKGSSLPPPFPYSEPSISPLKSVFWLAQTLLVSRSKSFAVQNTHLLCTLPVKLFSVIALAGQCGSVHSSLDCRGGIRKVLVMMHDDVTRVTNPFVCSIRNWCSVHSYFTQLSPVSRVTVPYYIRGIMCCDLKKLTAFKRWGCSNLPWIRTPLSFPSKLP